MLSLPTVCVKSKLEKLKYSLGIQPRYANIHHHASMDSYHIGQRRDHVILYKLLCILHAFYDLSTMSSDNQEKDTTAYLITLYG